MKCNNAELIQQLREITKNLLFSSESDDKFEAFFWKTSEQGVLTLERLLQHEGFLFPVKTNVLLEFISSPASWNWSTWFDSTTSIEIATKMSQKYQELIEFLSTQLKTFEIYLVSNLGYEDSDTRKKTIKKSKIGNPEYYPLPISQLHDSYKKEEICIEQEAFHIIVGETLDGDWLGIAPEMSRDSAKRGGQRFVLLEALVNEDTINIKRNLETMVLDLEFSVVECLTFCRKKQAIVEVGSIKEELLYRLLGSVGFFRAFTFKDYYRDNYKKSSQFLLLNEFLRKNLTNLQEYIVGLSARYFIYSVGHIEEDVLGVLTTATWT